MSLADLLTYVGGSGAAVVEVEGPSGAGKSTLIRALVAASGPGARCVDVAAAESVPDEPMQLVGDLMRAMPARLEPLEAAFLFCARTAGRCRVIGRLGRGGPVILLADRLRLSLYAQLRRAGLEVSAAAELTLLAARKVRPHLTILLDVDHAEHSRRVTHRGHVPTREREFRALRGWLCEAFDTLGADGPRLDTTGLTPEQVRDRVVATGVMPAL
ncbi:dTMP kinase [Nonomuraea turcica]|uniref:dTMP kinase n=1 Tax=Nonomuraea sp. G32 TaxID=3067274 RepID=UPI00273B3E59|nr:hypothetical protein [Nonomuraea sp. G32]MDP4500514.1 hypothetical protein [Nonomuraea sp. G32]